MIDKAVCDGICVRVGVLRDFLKGVFREVSLMVKIFDIVLYKGVWCKRVRILVLFGKDSF